jgi:glycosyltransferase involved in cell wall biosynthesis
MKILAVNIAFRSKDHYSRWRLFADTFEHTSVSLVGPESYVYKHFGEPIEHKPVEIQGEKFKVYHVNMSPQKLLRGDWWSWKFFKILLKEKPDIIYLIGYEARNALFISKLASVFMKNKPIIGLFSMRGLQMKGNIFTKLRWEFAKKWYSFIHVHYPTGADIYRNQINFKKHIALQTQVGVNKMNYYPSLDDRLAIRKKYNLKDSDFVFGSAIRIQDSKGVFEILEACEIADFDFKFLLLGQGYDSEKVKDKIAQSEKLKSIIIWPGLIHGASNVAAHMNAMDAFIHVPKTTDNWVDTFPLAVVQAMAIGLPVIGSDSGAIPYQLGKDALIVPEGDPKCLMGAMKKLFIDRAFGHEYGNALKERVLSTFEIEHLNRCLFSSFQFYLSQEDGKFIGDQSVAEFRG